MPRFEGSTFAAISFVDHDDGSFTMRASWGGGSWSRRFEEGEGEELLRYMCKTRHQLVGAILDARKV